jgi:hypothetical protein
MVFEPKKYFASMRPGYAPNMDGVRNVSEVRVPCRARCEPGTRPDRVAHQLG